MATKPSSDSAIVVRRVHENSVKCGGGVLLTTLAEKKVNEPKNKYSVLDGISAYYYYYTPKLAC